MRFLRLRTSEQMDHQDAADSVTIERLRQELTGSVQQGTQLAPVRKVRLVCEETSCVPSSMNRFVIPPTYTHNANSMTARSKP
jgi:hypothetical protein